MQKEQERIELTNYGYYQDSLYFDIKMKNKTFKNVCIHLGDLYSFLDNKKSLNSYGCIIESLINIQDCEEQRKNFKYKPFKSSKKYRKRYYL